MIDHIPSISICTLPVSGKVCTKNICWNQSSYNERTYKYTGLDAERFLVKYHLQISKFLILELLDLVSLRLWPSLVLSFYFCMCSKIKHNTGSESSLLANYRYIIYRTLEYDISVGVLRVLCKNCTIPQKTDQFVSGGDAKIELFLFWSWVLMKIVWSEKASVNKISTENIFLKSATSKLNYEMCGDNSQVPTPWLYGTPF